MATYSEKLKDPRWQKKRLEIFQRDNWTCQKCEDTEATLNAHHKDYLRNVELWDYPDELLITLCENCHNNELTRDNLEKLIITEMRQRFWSDDLFIILDGLRKLPIMKSEDSWMLSEVIRELFICEEWRNKLTEQVWSKMRGCNNAK